MFARDGHSSDFVRESWNGHGRYLTGAGNGESGWLADRIRSTLYGHSRYVTGAGNGHSGWDSDYLYSSWNGHGCGNTTKEDVVNVKYYSTAYSFGKGVSGITYIAVTVKLPAVPMAGLDVLVMKLPVEQRVVLALGHIVVVLVTVFGTGVSDDIRQWQALEIRADPSEVGAFLGTADFGVAR